MILVIDNYDSFTYNVVQYLQQLQLSRASQIGDVSGMSNGSGISSVARTMAAGSKQLRVVRNDQISLDEIAEIAPSGIVLSPGPGRPEHSGITCELITAFGGQIPIFGICLGHQAIAHCFGAAVVHAKQIMHGKVSELKHNNSGVFSGLPERLKVTRYHSLSVAEPLPDCLEVTAWVEESHDERTVMGLRHKTMDLEGVQFHPESAFSEYGLEMLNNFLSRI